MDDSDADLRRWIPTAAAAARRSASVGAGVKFLSGLFVWLHSG